MGFLSKRVSGRGKALISALQTPAMKLKLLSLLFAVVLISGCIGSPDMAAKNGDRVAVHYTGTLEDGSQFDSSEGREPLEFVVGSGQVIKGFDDGVRGMKVGEEKEVRIPPEDAYGTSGGHPLAGKTLIFKIKLVEIN